MLSALRGDFQFFGPIAKSGVGFRGERETEIPGEHWRRLPQPAGIEGQNQTSLSPLNCGRRRQVGHGLNNGCFERTLCFTHGGRTGRERPVPLLSAEDE